MTQKIITRFAPSPTGLLHGGNYRTALFAYIFARQNGGKFLLRIEDTDRERSKKEYEENILESLKWLGISYDGFSRQSENVGRHKEMLQKLIDGGAAYISREEKEGVTKDIVRFKNPGGKVTFTDMIRGEITIDVTDLGDFVIAKNINEPLFHLAVVVDDMDMGVTHIVRGEDHIPNTPRHLLLYRAFGAPEPVYAHLPMVLAPDRSKLSKRKGALPITEYRDRGFLPEAVVNFLALIGWNPGTEQEIFSIDELIKTFSFSHVQKAGAMFNEEKLRWFNREYLKKNSEKIASEIARVSGKTPSDAIVKTLVPIVAERIDTLKDISTLWDSGDLSLFFVAPKVPAEMLLWKGTQTKDDAKTFLAAVSVLLSGAKDTLSAEEAKALLWAYAEEKGRGQVLWPLRVALSGKEKSPDPFTLISILGTKESVARVQSAIKSLV